MKPAAFVEFTRVSKILEGCVPWMYLDILGLVTTGVGCLIDAPHEACKLPWRRPDGSPASASEIAGEWANVKANRALARQGHKAAAKFTRLRLDDEGVAELLEHRAADFEAFYRKTWPAWDSFPADAQLAIHSMGWAMGPGFPRKFPTFTKAVLAGDWAGAAAQCAMRATGNPGLIPRNKMNVRLFNAAASTSTPDAITAEAVARVP